MLHVRRGAGGPQQRGGVRCAGHDAHADGKAGGGSLARVVHCVDLAIGRDNQGQAVNGFRQAAEIPGDLDLLRAWCPAQVGAHGLGRGERFGQECVSRLWLASPANVLEDHTLGFLAHALHRAHAAGFTRRLEVLDRLDAECVLQRGDLREPEARNAVKCLRERRHASALLLEHFRASGAIELRDHPGEPRADAGDLGETAVLHQASQVGVETFQSFGAPRVSAGPERLLAGDLEERGHLAQGPGDRQPISHGSARRRPWRGWGPTGRGTAIKVVSKLL